MGFGYKWEKENRPVAGGSWGVKTGFCRNNSREDKMYMQQGEEDSSSALKQARRDGQEGGASPKSMENSLTKAGGRQNEGPGPGRFATVVVQPVASFLRTLLFSW